RPRPPQDRTVDQTRAGDRPAAAAVAGPRRSAVPLARGGRYVVAGACTRAGATGTASVSVSAGRGTARTRARARGRACGRGGRPRATRRAEPDAAAAGPGTAPAA